MAISHAGHDHPNTTAARTKCRKEMQRTGVTPTPSAERVLAEAAGIVKPARIVKVEPMGRGSGRYRKTGDQGVVKATRVKAYDRPIRTAGDLPTDIPANLVSTISAAWDLGYAVVEGMRLNDTETRILIAGGVAQVSIVLAAAGADVTNLTNKRYASNFDSSVFAPDDAAGTILVFHSSAPRQVFGTIGFEF